MRRRDFLAGISCSSALRLGQNRQNWSQVDRCSRLAAIASAAVPGAEAEQSQLLHQTKNITLANAHIQRSMSIAADGNLNLDALQNLKTGFNWAAPGLPTGSYLELGTNSFAGLEGGKGFHVLGSRQRNMPDGAVQQDIEVLHDPTQMKVTLLESIFPDSPFIEHQLKIRNQGNKNVPEVRRFDPLTFWLRGDAGPLRVYSLHDPSESSAREMTPHVLDLLTLRWQTVDASLSFAGTEGCAPWLIVENEANHEFMVVGIGFTVEWGLRLLRQDSRVLLTTGSLGSAHELEPENEIESPIIFLGVVRGSLDDAVNAWYAHLRNHILPDPPKDYPWVTYNIWYTEPGDMETPLKQEVDFSADLGIECFYHDAGWYEGADTVGSGLWGQGLGVYREMKSRFPHGLRSLSDYVHSKGMKFGVWVDPPNVDPIRVGTRVPERWLAQHDGTDWAIHVDVWKPDPGLKRLCLGCPEVVEYLKKSLTNVIESWSVDWLKWDPSGSSPFQQPCSRTDHGHQKEDGKYAAIEGEAEIFRYLSEKFPNLVVERCAGLDGLARYSRNFPVSYDECPRFETQKIRHRVIGASYWFPGGFGQSFIWDRPDPITNRADLEPIGFLMKSHSPAYLDNLFRSLMMTGFGFGTLDGSMSQRISRWHPDVLAAARRNIAAFKKYRHLLNGNVYHLLPQTTLYVPDQGEEKQWDALEYANSDGSEAVAFFFRGGSENPNMKTTLKGLRAAREYTIISFNTGQKRTVDADTLLRSGIEIRLPERDTSEILLMGPVRSVE